MDEKKKTRRGGVGHLKGGTLPFILSLASEVLAFAFPGVKVGTQGFVDCVCCVGEACKLWLYIFYFKTFFLRYFPLHVF
jgi:hypothetical protein